MKKTINNISLDNQSNNKQEKTRIVNVTKEHAGRGYQILSADMPKQVENEDFSKNLVKEYRYWSIYVHSNQGYLGRCVIWCKRDNTFDLTDATPEEQQELFLVLNDLRKAVKKLFQPDWFNYSFLGNDTHHLHGHFIPRYAKPKTFMNITFEDRLYGHNYKTDHDFKTPDELLKAVRDKLAKTLKH